MKDFETLKPRLNRIQQRALLVGLAVLALCAVGAVMSPEQFFRSYLIGYLFWISIALGSIAIVALHHLVGGGWGFVIQRVLESGARTLPLMAILFIPFFFGTHELYSWARPEVVAADEILRHKSIYLNQGFFWIRTAAYFAIWWVFIYFLTKWSFAQDRSANPSLTDRIKKLSGPTILLYVLLLTFASVDWVMSLEPHFYSTIYGFIFVIGQALLTLSFAIVVLAMVAEYKPLAEVIQTKHYHDLGNLMLAFVMLWGYIAVSQLLIVWSGNLPEEIIWYLHRTQGGWQWVALFIAIFHFGVPFFLLLSRRTKRNINVLFKVALAMLFMRWVHLYWLVEPVFHPGKLSFHWLDILTPIGIGGIWIAAFVWQLKGRPLLPINDPRLKEVFQHE